MRKVSLLFAGTFLLLGFSKTSYGQASATANVSATIIAPIAISKSNDMNFGRVAATAAAGTVVLAPAGTRTFTGGVTLPSFGGTGDVSPAIFDVSGAPDYTYSITLPTTATTIANGSNTMTVDTWTSSPTPIGTLAGDGTQTLRVGATLNVGANQAPGVYTSATPFTVTVNYN
ncbi:DUF4402 domain-containing protein [Chitinophaga sancti]|uniref:DUF4402 domain-containing protein n=1 Tax=Chitinophaga sancti TaxID=1004 RepID=A0A1K1MPZ5_9BACT|nr:DUF4402 domain-containing protein [Chitinophaga sancti]WQD62880.1 DUF4402 domain-containing protein [Chitinophaga sancti]WQG91496.1 DUF4402 domain-containing protein [Chitinophaga sancti]SFW25199.1 protein of unknown function [Chitinophaga sancti]